MMIERVSVAVLPQVSVPYRLAQGKADRRGLRLIYLKMMVSSLVQNN
jgi:hypothetical protein